MDIKERQIIRILKLVERESITLKEAAELLSVSYRHMRRIYKSFKHDGNYCLIHGLQGRESNRRIDESIRKEILRCFKENFRYYGPTTAAKKLNRLGYDINRETLRKWLLEEGLWKGKSKHSSRKIMRRQQKHFGELLQLGSMRISFSGQKNIGFSLLYLIDDATKITISLPASRPAMRAAMRLLGKWIKKYGIPMSICCSRKLLFQTKKSTDNGTGKAVQNRGKKIITSFSRACDRLGIATIVKDLKYERKYLRFHLNQYKKQLLQKLETKGIGSLERAQEIIHSGFIDEMNRIYGEPPVRPQDFHVQLEAEDDLNSIICFIHKKNVSHNLLVRHKGKIFRITDGGMLYPSPYTQVQLAEWLDGSVHVYYGKRELKITEVINHVVNDKKL